MAKKIISAQKLPNTEKPLKTEEPHKTKKSPKKEKSLSNEKTCNDEKIQDTPLENIIEMGQAQLLGKNPRGNIHCMTVIGQIEGHIVLPPQNKTTKYEHVIPQLVAIEDNPDIDGLLLILNTVGGDVEAGLAISEMIASMSKPTVSIVLGGGHSIGVPMAVSTQYSYICPSATMTVHPIRLNGLIIGVPQTFEYFNRMQERVVRFVVSNSKIDSIKFKQLMLETGELANDVGTILFGEDAVRCGLINEVGGLSTAMDKLYSMIEMKRAAGDRK